MSGDYLWDKSGPPDPDVEKLEEQLGSLRYRPRPRPEVAPAQTEAAKAPAERPARVTFLRPRVVALACGLAAAAALAIVVTRRVLEPPGAAALAQRLGSVPTAPWDRIDARLRPGEWLETNSWEAQVAIADIGHVQVAPRTRIRDATTLGGTQHRLELAHGKIHAKVTAPPKVFVVGTPAAEAVDLGCEYTLEVDDAGDGYLAVSLGWVELEASAKRSLVPAGARCRIQHGFGPGTPYFKDASEALRGALDRFDFHADKGAVRTVLAEARRRDALSLWHLLPRVDEATRREVYVALKALVPPPVGCTLPDVIRLDEIKLDQWKDELAVTW